MNAMKKIFQTLAICLLTLVLPAGVFASTAETTFVKFFASTDTGDATGPAGAYLAFGGTVGYSGSTPVVDFASLTADNAADRFYLLSENGDSTTTDASYSSGGKVLPVTATTSFQADTPGAGSWVAIIDYAAKKFEVNRVSSISAGVSLNLVRNTTNTYASGSTVKELTVLYSVPVGNATATFQGGKLNGQIGEVLGWYLDGTSSCRINAVSGHYEK